MTDLEVASLGPAAAVSRTYISGATTSRFAPGWWFSFDQNLDLSQASGSPNLITYTDPENVQHRFYRGNVNCPWEAPNGFFATLTASGSNWKLTYDDQTVLTFDSTGRLTREAPSTHDDAQSTNLVTYAWGADSLTITAANGAAGRRRFLCRQGHGRELRDERRHAHRCVLDRVALAGDLQLRRLGDGPDRQVQLRRERLAQRDGAGGLAGERPERRAPGGEQRRAGEGGRGRLPGHVLTHAVHTVEKSDARATITYDSATQATVKHYGTVTDAKRREPPATSR